MRDLWGAGHDPDVVPRVARNDGLRVIFVEIGDQEFGFDWPDELHAPDGVALRVAHKSPGRVALHRSVRTALAEGEGGGDRAVGRERVALNRMVRLPLDERGNVCDHMPVAHEARQIHVRHRCNRCA